MTFGLLTKGYVCGKAGFTSTLIVAIPTVKQIHKIIRSFIGTVLEDDLLKECKFAYDNAPFDKPNKACWVRATIKTLESKQVMFGSKRTYRIAGLVQFQLFGPIELGDGVMNAQADIIMDQFRGRNISGIRFRAPSTGNRKRSGDEWMIVINCPFQADQIA